MKFSSMILIIMTLTVSTSLWGATFEELDKPPEGAHKGQMFLGGSLSIGGNVGPLINSEKDFVQDNTYQFEDSGIYKELWISHLNFAFAIFFEYMPIDYLGIKTKFRHTRIIQQTNFGSEFQNWTKTLYNDWAFLVGPTVHATTRKQWDFSFTPVLGYSIAFLNQLPLLNFW